MNHWCRRTYRVIFQHAHRRRGSETLKGVEVSSRGHGQEPDNHDTGFRCVWGQTVSSAFQRVGKGFQATEMGNKPFLAILEGELHRARSVGLGA